MEAGYDQLMDLEINVKYDWTIMVRVSRKWSATNDIGDLNGVHVIVIDESHKRMHVWIDAKVLPDVPDKLQPGKNYKIQNIIVQRYTEKYRCFDSDKHIIITPSTVITNLPDEWGLIPDQILYFTNLNRIRDVDDENSFFIDVVGIVQDLKPMEEISNPSNEKQVYLDFEVTDLIVDVKVRLWDDFANKFEKLFHESTEHPVILILSSCKIICNDYNGVKTLTNFTATNVDMNSNCFQVNKLRQRFWEVNVI